MTKAVRLREHGGPDVLRLEDVEPAEPGPGEVRIRHKAIGLNFIDVYFRTGLYEAELPHGLGLEAAGTIEAVGADVAGLAEGDRVAYCSPPLGAYADSHVMPADRVVTLPAGIDFETAAGAMLKGMTAQYLLRRTYPLKAGDTVLIHAAAGGVGTLLVQWAHHLGATVIGTVGSKDKAEHAAALGCDHPIDYRKQDFKDRVEEITEGRGVQVVYDAVGKAVFDDSLDCLAPRGMMVTFGNASGPVDPVSPLTLSEKGSLFLTRPTLFHYIATRGELEQTAADLFDVIESGAVEIEIGQRYALKDAAQAHRDLEARKTTGSTVLIP